jgi:hypothetical protein
MGAVQAGVTLLSVIDVLFVSLHFGATRAAAQYQVSATLTRFPLFIAIAMATAVFPTLAQRPGDRAVLSAHLEHLLLVLVPILLLVASVPAAVIHAVLPTAYGHAVKFFPLTAGISTVCGVVLFQTTVFRATGVGESCLQSLGTGIAVAVVCMSGGAVGGIFDAGLGALAGALAAATSLALRTEKRWPGAQRPSLSKLGLWLFVGALLVAARSLTALWIAIAIAAGLATVRVPLSFPEVPPLVSDPS